MTVTLDYWERKKRLPRGAVTTVARRRGVSPQYVSQVLRVGKGRRDIERELARLMGVAVDVAFGAPAPSPARPAEDTALARAS